jgi:hypothetical protein
MQQAYEENGSPDYRMSFKVPIILGISSGYILVKESRLSFREKQQNNSGYIADKQSNTRLFVYISKTLNRLSHTFLSYLL